ncbi:MAG: RNA polymerase subunit sigma-24 [Chlorobiaceae bacterium]|nr:RNA polymerase subunit sigma-24 [Chlorobiaceae bacterium]NTV60371.1 RNA polymerase subunit sigma-24 [Chlorobiaceae bacterium]
MIKVKKTPLDILDDVYSLAYWMTGSEKDSQDLVRQTYLFAGRKQKETDLLRVFRECYIETYGQDTEFCIDEKACKGTVTLVDTLKQWAADIKLTVLLSEISGLGHRQIASIVGKPIETVRQWLLTGRRLLVSDYILKASA